MYVTAPMRGSSSLRKRRAPTAAPAYQAENVRRVIERVAEETGDAALRQSLHFSTGVVDRITRQMQLGCTVVTDSNLICTGIDRAPAEGLPVRFSCSMDDPMVVNFAEQKRITRAEVAVEQSLSISGPKLIVIGSAPMALSRLLQLHKNAPLREVVIIGAATGFANIVELKERLWESGLPCVVARGRKGGPVTAIAIVNALLQEAAAQRA